MTDPPSYTIKVSDDLGTVAAEDWNRLAGNANPFTRHEFLHALERNRCVGEDSGWYPQHLLLYDGEQLVGATPLYQKTHSYGEFVFDWAWAEAYARAGMDYYPKLVAAIPFTPVTGHRLLVATHAEDTTYRRLLTQGALECARQMGVSSMHWLFATEAGGGNGFTEGAEDGEWDDQERDDSGEGAGLLARVGCQFHWLNRDFASFDDYLGSLNSKRRKQIRRERREAAQAPVEIEVLTGTEITPSQWRAYHQLYASTYDRKWGYPSLNVPFFEEIGRTMGERVLLVLARDPSRPAGDEDAYVAGAHFLVGSDCLFGRNWGCTEHHRALHFEMCYYRGIEYCIEHNLQRFEAGAQGEHKIWRGFMPVATHSVHWIAHPQFRRAIARFLSEERCHTQAYIQEMESHSPYRGD